METMESEIENQSSSRNLDVYTALLYCAITAQAEQLDKKMVKGSNTELVLKSAQMTGLALTLQQTGKAFGNSVLVDLGLSTTAKGIGKGIGKATIIIGGVISVYETVTLFMDWNGTHLTIAGAERVVEELNKAQSSLNKRTMNLKLGMAMIQLIKI